MTTPRTQTYGELPGLEDVCLEDSFVREIVETTVDTSFALTVALTPEHPDYETPAPKEAHRYRTALLTFPNVRAKTWLARTHVTFTDADGAVDHGNIDRFTIDGDGLYRLAGEWGEIALRSDPPELLVLHPETHEHRDARRRYAAWLAGRATG